MTTSNIPNPVQILKEKFRASVGLPFRELLPEVTIQEALNALEIKYRRRLFDPFVTLWTFLSQVLRCRQELSQCCQSGDCLLIK